MFNSFATAAAAAALVSASGAASALTLNAGTVDCFLCTTDGSGVNLEAGDKYAIANPAFLDQNGVLFDVLVEVLAEAADRVGTFDAKAVESWVHLRLTTVEAGSANAVTPDGTVFAPAGLTGVSIEDIDSNAGQDFTDVAGLDLSLAGIGSALELGGFETDLGQPMAGFTYARLDPAFAGDTGNWTDEENVANAPTHTASFFTPAGTSSFEFVWGSTGDDDIDGVTRGWEVTFEVAPIPLPAGAWFALTGLAALGGMRRLRKTA